LNYQCDLTQSKSRKSLNLRIKRVSQADCYIITAEDKIMETSRESE
jgi:hypothetical protein